MAACACPPRDFAAGHGLTSLLLLPSSSKVADVSVLLRRAYFHLYRRLLHPVTPPTRSSPAQGALKLKEMAYIHAEGYSGGALKHGPFALIEGAEGDNGATPIILIILDDEHAHQVRLSLV